MFTPMLLALGLTLAGEAKADAKNYTLDLNGTSKEVHVGKDGTLKLLIKPAQGFKISAEAPLKIGLDARGLELSKKALGHDDAKDKKSTSPEFDVKFAGTAPGSQSIQVDAMFFVCNEKLCERKTEKVTIPVNVKS